MLWDLIRDFFVQHVFGGVDSLGDVFNCKLGAIADSQGNFDPNGNINDLYVSIGDVFYDGGYSTIGTQYLSVSDWLSTTATIISITIIVILCCMFIYKIVKLIGGLIR